MKKKLLAIVLTLCMMLGLTAIPAMAANNGPSDGEDSEAWVWLEPYDDPEEVKEPYVIWERNEEEGIDTVNGVSYDLTTNTLTINNVNMPDYYINANEMGDDFKIKVTGTNNLQAICVWGYGYGGNLEICGDGTLALNESKVAQNAILMYAEETEGRITVGSDVTLTLYKGTPEDEDDEGLFPIAILESTATQAPITINGKLETPLVLDDESGEAMLELPAYFTSVKDGKTYENFDSYATYNICTKEGDSTKYIYREAIGTTGKIFCIFRLVECDGLKNDAKYLAVYNGYTTAYDLTTPAGYTVTQDTAKVALEYYKDGYRGYLVKNTNTGKQYVWDGYGRENGEPAMYEIADTFKRTVGVSEDGQLRTEVNAYLIGDKVDGRPGEGGFEFAEFPTGSYYYLYTNDVIRITPADKTQPGSDNKPADTTGSQTGTDNKPADTNGSQTGTSDKNTNTNTTSPQTGDNSNIALWFALLLVSGGTVTTLSIYDKKKKQQTE